MDMLENKECICPHVKCPRHGICGECRKHHAEHKKNPPYCERAKEKAEKQELRVPRRSR